MKRNMALFIATGIIMGLFPFLAARFVPADAGMAVCFMLFFAVNPVLSVLVGVSAGKNAAHFWYQPITVSVLFLIGTWLFFDMGEIAFLYYAMVYCILGLIAMFLTMAIRKYNIEKKRMRCEMEK